MIDDSKIVSACQSSSSMSEACGKLGMNYQTFRKHAKRLGVFITNQSGKGIKGEKSGKEYPLEDILAGKYPHYSSHKLRKRLIEARLKENKCEECGIGPEWNDKPLSMHLDHIDGNHCNHQLINLRILCPNCHSQTETFGSRKLKLQ